MAIVSRNNNYIFFHIPKCGGISMSDVLPNKQIVKNINDTHYNYFETKYVFDVNGETEFFNKANKFALVRNPFDRAISLYRSIMENKKHHLHTYFSNKTFTQFCYFLKNIGDNSITSCKAHLIDDDGNIDSSIRIFKLEEINNHLEELSDIVGDKINSFPHINISSFFYDITEESDLLVRDIFEDDFNAFYRELI